MDGRPYRPGHGNERPLSTHPAPPATPRGMGRVIVSGASPR
ncbi:hypothetical protein SXCC_04174 [Gluconacetobacter sp. SXCC-1]|nr:hypothetical protein SXCC_04174 [Gluconacetobacter sp. SXCC-1]